MYLMLIPTNLGTCTSCELLGIFISSCGCIFICWALRDLGAAVFPRVWGFDEVQTNIVTLGSDESDLRPKHTNLVKSSS
jgi:hypothetical protein